MNLLTKAEFARWAGKSSPAVTKALKQGRLDLFQGTNKINTGSPKSQTFKATIGRGQKNIIPSVPTSTAADTPEDKNIKHAGEKVLLAQEKKTIEEAELKRQTRIDKELKNAYTRGELVSIEAIEQTNMMFLDRWLNTNKRVFSAMFDEIQRKLLATGEKDPQLKREFLNRMEAAADQAKTKTVELLREIQIEQGRR